MTSTPTPADLVVAALAVARAVRLLQEDEVPFAPARNLLLDMYGDRKIADLATCPWCLSIWVSGAAVLVRHRWPRLWAVLSHVLAGSQVTGMIAEQAHR